MVQTSPCENLSWLRFKIPICARALCRQKTLRPAKRHHHSLFHDSVKPNVAGFAFSLKEFLPLKAPWFPQSEDNYAGYRLGG
jgi:hypothetical protein